MIKIYLFDASTLQNYCILLTFSAASVWNYTGLTIFILSFLCAGKQLMHGGTHFTVIGKHVPDAILREHATL